MLRIWRFSDRVIVKIESHDLDRRPHLGSGPSNEWKGTDLAEASLIVRHRGSGCAAFVAMMQPRCASLKMITWSRHSRRIEPMILFDAHPLTRVRKTGPYVSVSSRYLGAVFQGKAWVIWWDSHACV